ncbi:hypothetical protein OOT46_17430 [Aquabacterium sp. A7-Y]|uniref:hypothetical protein n=1 Tax=Aquabacterium sp. A7-Y TaxID=1349605 RepID=UPI00223CE0D3|nr:hypothetical protein [Aquabacterium sp. A7-Y]MCW7539628.1 hypothetical protein [Aquabacterium sp. A7-Y]
MNIALPAVVVFLLVLPGFLVRMRFKRVERSVLDASPFGRVATEATILATLLHIFWILLGAGLFDRHFELRLLLNLLGSHPEAQRDASERIGAQADWLAFYFVSLYLASWLLPTLARDFVSARRWDRLGSRFGRVLRFNDAPWYYLLSGADFAPGEVPDLILISAVVNVGKEPWLYVGVLDDYFMTPSGDLDRLVLQNVRRRRLADDREGPDADAPDRFYAIDGDYLVLRYTESTTVNVKYVKLPAPEPDAAQPPALLPDASPQEIA